VKTIVFTDPHITEDSLSELEGVFTEILRYSKEAPILICVGDYYDKKNPSSREIDFGTKWAMKFSKVFKTFYMITGNHPEIDKKISSVSYLEYLGIVICEELIFDNVYYGHYMVKESTCGFNESKSSIELTDAFKLSILGHQHSWQRIIDDNGSIIHPGSCRYVDFGEASDKGKNILLVDACDYVMIRLTKTRPMYEVSSVTQLVPLPKEAQVRVVYTDFNAFLAEADLLEKYKSEFYKFKTKFSFTNIPNAQEVNVDNSTKDIIDKWLDGISNEEVKAELIAEFKNSGVY